VYDTATQWIHISKIIRVNSTVIVFDGWCSGLPAYVEKITVTPPPVVDSVTLDIVLHDVKVAGDVYTAVGVKASKTA
jgi:L-ascorbate metabolism protein UlaG (beta-lactamase superfamily)